MKDDRGMYKSQGEKAAHKFSFQKGKNQKSRQTRCPATRHQGVRFKLCGCGCRFRGPCAQTSMKFFQRSVLDTINEEEGDFGDEGWDFEECYEAEVDEFEVKTGPECANVFLKDDPRADDSVEYDVKTCEYSAAIDEAREADDALWTWDAWYGVWTHPTKGSFEVEEDADEVEDFEFECDTVSSFSLYSEAGSFATEQSYVLPSLAMSRTTSLSTVGGLFQALEIDDDEVEDNEAAKCAIDDEGEDLGAALAGAMGAGVKDGAAEGV